jgi:predicted transcriptional regulator
MRTTLSIDDDVAKILERLRRTRKRSFKAIVNDALRKGLSGDLKSVRRKKLYQTRSVDLGHCRLGTLDDIAEVIAIAEGDAFK